MRSLDLALFSLINAGAATPRWLIDVAAFISDAMPALVVGAFTAGALFVRAWRRPLLVGLLSLLLVWGLVMLFRSAIQVPRPAAMGLGVQWASQGIRPGFPSMHASGSFAFAMSLVFARLRGPALVLFVFALGVAWSRVFLGLHFPSDVLAGAVLGTLAALAVERGVRRALARAERSS
ncbi:MAG TPA: phosphatase PAP2 family protein [Candidatus Limnocylindrales bacterium]|nr:phosphatase PAP2 family protein [Candidatus Limnocylindrales bacterium]